MKMFGKRTLSWILTICVVLSSMVATVGAQMTSRFSDFPNDWSTDAVTAAVNNGLLNGYDDGTVRAGANLTRAEMATIINRAFGAVIEADISGYKDVSPSAWYYKEIAKGVNMRTFQGNGDGYMYPENPITREETFAVIARALVLSSDTTEALDKFVDKSSVSDWAANSLAALVELGYVNGDPNLRVNPQDYITRAEFATIMHNIFKKYISVLGTYKNLTVNGSLMINKGPVVLTDTVIYGDLVIGDGVHISTVTLKNVTIHGRLLVRGAQKPGKVKLEKSSVKGGILVNNVNGTVYFDNYKTDAQFIKTDANTPVEFKKPSTGGGGGSTGGGSGDSGEGGEGGGDEIVKRTVKFVNGVVYDDNGNPVENIVGSVEVEDGKSFKEYLGEAYKLPTVSVEYTEEGNSSNDYTHKVSQLGWYAADDEGNRGALYTETSTISADITLYPGWREFSAEFDTERYEGIPKVEIGVDYAQEGRVIDTVTDMLFANRNKLMTGITQYDQKAFEKPVAQKFVRYSDKQIKMVDMNLSFSDIFGSTAEFKKLFQPQIDSALATFDSLPAELQYLKPQVEQKIDDALKQIAEDKVWKLTEGNIIDVNTPIAYILGGEAQFEQMLRSATQGVLDAVTDEGLKTQIENELDLVIGKIVKADANDTLKIDNITHLNTNMTLASLYNTTEAPNGFADMLKGEVKTVLDTYIPVTEATPQSTKDIKASIQTALNKVVDNELVANTIWPVDKKSTVEIELTLQSLFNGNQGLIDEINAALETEILKISDADIQEELRTEIKPEIAHLINTYTTWKYDGEYEDGLDGFAEIEISKNINSFFDDEDDTTDNAQEFTNKILGTIEDILGSYPYNIDDEIIASIIADIRGSVEALAAAESWQVGKDKTNVSLDVSLDSVYGGEGKFAETVKQTITATINNYSATNPVVKSVQGDIETAIGKILAEEKWSLAFDGGKIKDKNINITPDVMFADDGGFSAKVNSIIDGLFVDPETDTDTVPAYLTDLHTAISTSVNTVIGKPAWNIGDTEGIIPSGFILHMGPNVLIDATAEADAIATIKEKIAEAEAITDVDGNLVADIDDDFVAEDFVNTMLNSTTWDYNATPYNAVPVNAKYYIRNVFGGKEDFETMMKGKVTADSNVTKLTGSSVTNINTAIDYIAGADTWKLNDEYAMADVTFEVLIKDFLDAATLSVIQSAADMGNFMAKAIINGEYCSGVGAGDFAEKLEAALDGVDFVTYIADAKTNGTLSPELKSAIDLGLTPAEIGGALNAVIHRNDEETGYLDELDKVIADTALGFATKLSVPIELDVTRLFVEKMKEQLTGFAYESTEIKNNPNIAAIVAVVGEDAVKEAIDGNPSATPPVEGAIEIFTDSLNGINETGISTRLDINIKFNLNALFLETIKAKIDERNNQTSYGSLIPSDLSGIVTWANYNDALTTYSGEIQTAINNKSAMADNKVDITLGEINVTQLMLQKIEEYIAGVNISIPTDIKDYVTGENGEAIDTTLTNAKNAYVGSVSAAAVSASSSFYPNSLSFVVNIDVNKMFLTELKKEVEKVTYNSHKATIKSVLGEGTIKYLGEDIVADAVDKALGTGKYATVDPRIGYVAEISAALADEDKSVGDTITAEIPLDVPKVLLDGMLEMLDTIDVGAVVGGISSVKNAAVEEAIDQAVTDVKTALETDINAALAEPKEPETEYKPFKTTRTVKAEINVNQLLIDGMNTKINGDPTAVPPISAMSYAEIEPKIPTELKNYCTSVGVTDAEFQSWVMNAVNVGENSYGEKIKSVINGETNSLDNKVMLNVELYIVKQVVDTLGDKLNEKDAQEKYIISYDNPEYHEKIVANNLVSSIITALNGDETLTRKTFDEAIQNYRDQIVEINKPDSTKTTFDTKIPEIEVNITELVLNGMITKLNGLEYYDSDEDASNDVSLLVPASLRELLTDEYLEPVFEEARDTMVQNIENSMKPENESNELSCSVFRINLKLDVYNLLLKKINEQAASFASYAAFKQNFEVPAEFSKLEAVLGEELMEEQYNKVIGTNGFFGRVSDAATRNNDIDTTNDVAELDCAIIIHLNPISEIIIPLYNKHIGKVEEKLGVYYTDNAALKEVKEMMNPSLLLDTVDNSADPDKDMLTGYKLKSYDEYYDMIERLTLLSGQKKVMLKDGVTEATGAINKFSEMAKAPGVDLEGIVSTYIDLGYDYYYKLVDLARTVLEKTERDIDLDEVLPTDETLEGKRDTAKDIACKLVRNPDMTTQAAIEQGFAGMKEIDKRLDENNMTGTAWDEFVWTNTKKQETVTVRNTIIIHHPLIAN